MALETNIKSEIRQRLEDAAGIGNIVVFFGAGVSKDAGFPSWRDLISQLIDVIRRDRITNVLAASGLETVSANWPLDVLDVVKNTHRPYFLDKYRAIFPQSPTKYKSTQLGRDIALLSTKRFITLNYDLCFQKALADVGRIDNVGMTLRTLDETKFDNSDKTLLCQIHGSAEEGLDEIVLTKTQYNRAYRAGERLPQFLSHVFGNYSLLSLGYGFNDDKINELLVESNAYSNVANHNLRLAIRGYTLDRENEAPGFHTLAKHQWDVDVVEYSIRTKGTSQDHSDLKRVIADIGDVIGIHSNSPLASRQGILEQEAQQL